MNSRKFDELFAAECAGDEKLLQNLESLLQPDAKAEAEFFPAKPSIAPTFIRSV